MLWCEWMTFLATEHAAGINNLRCPAGDSQAKTAEAEDTDMTLRADGYPTSSWWRNDKVRRFFGQCSKQHHRLLAIQDFYLDKESREDFLAQWKLARKNFQGCRPFQEIRCARFPYSMRLGVDCETCDQWIEFSMYSSRLIAILKLQHSQLWKAVIPRRYGPREYSPNNYIFEGSARCNGSGHEGRNHCMTPSHLNMETVHHNARRKGHHLGRFYCECRRLCIGQDVQTLVERDGCCGSRSYSTKRCTGFVRESNRVIRPVR